MKHIIVYRKENGTLGHFNIESKEGIKAVVTIKDNSDTADYVLMNGFSLEELEQYICYEK